MMFYDEILQATFCGTNIPVHAESQCHHCTVMLSLSAVQPEIKICIITEQKCVERLYLFHIFIRLLIRNKQDVLQISSTEKDAYYRD